MLVIMVRAIFKPSFTFPIAQYPTSSLTAEELYPLVWNAVEALELNEIEVISITCDGLSANHKFFSSYFTINHRVIEYPVYTKHQSI